MGVSIEDPLVIFTVFSFIRANCSYSIIDTCICLHCFGTNTCAFHCLFRTRCGISLFAIFLTHINNAICRMN